MSLSHLAIRKAEERDLEAIEQLESECFSDPWRVPWLQEALAQAKSLILVAGEPVYGYFIGWNVLDEAEIARIAVTAQMRGQAVGQHLLEAALGEFKQRGVENVFLEVRESNSAARSLYQRCGFEEIGRRKNYYADGETACVLKKIL